MTLKRGQREDAESLQDFMNQTLETYFQKVIAAVAFSPRLEANLCELVRIQKHFKSEITLIHVGERTSEKEDTIHNICERVGLKQVKLVWTLGNPVKQILNVCAAARADLLVMGALSKEGFFKYYIGSVARQIIRKLPCSVLVMPEPEMEPSPFRRIGINVNENRDPEQMAQLGIYLAQKEQSEMLYFTKEVTKNFLSAVMSKNLSQEELQGLHEGIRREEESILAPYITQCEQLKIPSKKALLFGKSGYEIRNFALENLLDLLVIQAPEKNLGIFDRLFQHDLEYILEELPCNLLIIKPPQ